MQVPEKAKHYGLTAKLDTPVDPAKGLVLQYELKLTDGLTCGGAYLKFLTATADFDPAELTDGTPYTVMFGPDKCGSTNKVRPYSIRPRHRVLVCLHPDPGRNSCLMHGRRNCDTHHWQCCRYM